MTIFERIKNLSNKCNLSLEEVAKQAGINVNIIYQWENSSPNDIDLKKIANVLGVSDNYLLGIPEDEEFTDLAYHYPDGEVPETVKQDILNVVKEYLIQHPEELKKFN